MLSADNVTYANDFFASHRKTCPRKSASENGTRGDHSLSRNPYGSVGVFTLCGNTSSRGGPLSGWFYRCEAKGKSLFFVSLRVLAYPQSILDVLFLYLVLTLKSSDTLR